MENLVLLSRNRAEYAIVQGDLVHKGWEGQEAPEYAANEWTTIDFDRLRLVRWLFSERSQITAGPHAYISSLADLRRKHVWLGRRNGGTYATAWEVLRAAGLAREDLREVGVSDYDEANSKLLKGSLDAVFRVTPEILDRARVQDAKLVLVCSAWCRADSFDRRGSMDVELADNYTIRAIHGIRMLDAEAEIRIPCSSTRRFIWKATGPRQKAPQARP